jgi:glucan 1,3-beta-glucosidase
MAKQDGPPVRKFRLHSAVLYSFFADGGTNYGPATAGTANAQTFWQSGVCGMLDWGVDVFYFEAFDEPSKPDSIGQDGAAENEQHWGALNSDRSLKFSLSC